VTIDWELGTFVIASLVAIAGVIYGLFELQNAGEVAA
jgi:hypothetical protein